MFLGCGLMVVGPRRSDGRTRAKGSCGVGMVFRKPKWMSRQKTLSAASGDHSSNDLPPSYIHASGEPSFEGLPEMVASFDPHQFNPGEFVKRFRERRALERSREKRSNAPSPEPVMEGKLYEDSINKE
jgi:hypothetical protein